MADDTVCVECFADDFLRDLVRREGAPSDEDDECRFCGAVGEPRIDAGVLANRFEAVVRRLYKPDQEMEFPGQAGSGEPLGDLLRDHLGALKPEMDEPDELVRAVLGERWRNVHQDDFYPDLDASWIANEHDWSADPSYKDSLDALRTEVLQLGHSFHVGPGKRVSIDELQSDLAYDRIKHALKLTELMLAPGTKLYRARLDVGETKRSNPDEFRPPPVGLAKAARANLQGERAWYLAREPETARDELRPGRASEVSVAEFTLPTQLRLCDLDHRVLETSPFDDIDKYVQEEAVADVANAMGYLFAKPIRSSDTDTEYLITQLLARMIREAGFDGIAYPSSQHDDGLNYVLFDPTLSCAFGSVQTYECERVTYMWRDSSLRRTPRGRVADDADKFDEERFDPDDE